MNKLWFPALAALLLLVGCTPDHTLESLIPRNSLVVVLVDHPAWAAQTLGAEGGFPWKSLETGKPWAAAVLPANPPGFLLALALADTPTAWTDLRHWAQERGGLSATRLGSYAVLTSPGLAAPAVLDPDRRFDLERVRAGGDAIAAYVDLGNALAEANLPPALQPASAVFPWAAQNLAGLRLGFGPKEGGIEMRLATDWKPSSPAANLFRGWVVPSDPSGWSGLLSADGIGLVASLPVMAWKSLMVAPPGSLSERWGSLAPLLGPRLAVSVFPRSGSWSWTLAVESQDPQAVRQALKTLVASGDLQRQFPQWALDADTPLIYRDLRSAGAPRATVHWGPSEIDVAYAPDRVVLAGGPGASERLDLWSQTPRPAAWVGQAPPQATALALGSFDGLAAKAAVRILPDANLEFRTWIDRDGVKSWEERLPQALLGWLAGEGGQTNLEP